MMQPVTDFSKELKGEECALTLDVSTLTLEDFSTPTPYRFLCQQSRKLGKDPQYVFLVQALRSKAKELGFASRFFDEALARQFAIEFPSAGSQLTAFPDQPVQLSCGSYCCDEGGVSYPGRFGIITVCPHPIMPVARVVDDDTGESFLRIAFSRDGKWKEITLRKSDAFTASKIVQLADRDVSVTSESAKELVQYLCWTEAANSKLLPVIRTTGKLGWHGNRFVPYDDKIQFLSGSSQITSNIKECGEYSLWLETARAIRDNERQHLPARLALAASFASPLLSKLGQGYAPFWANLNSSISSSGKTVALMLAASVWGNPEVGRLLRTARDTINSMETTANALNNIPLFIDELQTVQREVHFSDFAYNICEGTGKKRLDRNVKERPDLTWKSTVLSSGERTVTNDSDHEGALARVIEVQVRQTIFDNPHDVANCVKANYGHAGREYIQGILAEDLQALDADVQKLSIQLQAEGIQQKQADAGAILVIADRLAAKYIFYDEFALSPSDVKPFLRMRADTDMNRRIFEHVCDWIEQYGANFVDDYDKKGKNVYHPLQYYGKRVDEKHFRLLRKPLMEELDRNGYNFHSFLEWCVDHGAMDSPRGRQARHDGKTERLLDFHTDALDKKDAVYEQPIEVENPPDLPF
ncbi:MAG: DUF927 domain-containing protein [Clostridiales bacterium]|nr:DUF927 domain-containing protein [Clostridiales bacterium]